MTIFAEGRFKDERARNVAPSPVIFGDHGARWLEEPRVGTAAGEPTFVAALRVGKGADAVFEGRAKAILNEGSWMLPGRQDCVTTGGKVGAAQPKRDVFLHLRSYLPLFATTIQRVASRKNYTASHIPNESQS